ncbi:threonine--tRNA ligase [Patescibacteria group bacterium]|nr:threonine--tRNA ligase [Patescibacteria group bacterium]
MKKDASLDNIRHSFAHILAAAVKKLYPKAQLGMGPVIENGFYYDFDKITITDKDLPRVEKEMRKIASQKLSFTRESWTTAKAKKFFRGQPYKLELIRDLKIKKVGIEHIGDLFIDLCRGGHVKHTKELPLDAFKLTHTAGAYWKGNEKRPMLTRVYGAAFKTKKELEQYLWQREEAKKRDHRVLGEKLRLFTFAEEVGPGLPLWLPNGTILRDEIEAYAKEVEKERGYERVTTPHIAKEKLYRISGHIPYYADSMYPPMKLDDGNYYLKAMNCPHTHMIYKSELRSYRDLPIRYAEFGTVYRYELSGTLNGLLRVRGFTTNDAHIYCREDQAEEEFLQVMKLHEFWYKKIFNIQDFYMRLSLPSKDKAKYGGVPKEWQRAVDIVRKAMKKSKLPFEEVEGEAAFYGPKVDFQIKSVVGREETASTNQLDFFAKDRFNLVYKDKDGKNKPVYVIHRAPLGSHERFIAFLIEHYAGAFPLWLSPEQVWVVPVSDKFAAFANMIAAKLQKVAASDLRVMVKDENGTLGKKIREGEMQKIPYLAIVGEKEQKNKSLSVRKRGGENMGSVGIKQFATQLDKEIKSKK